MAVPPVTFYISLYWENIKKIFLSESNRSRSRALIIGMEHHPVDLYYVYTNYAPGAILGGGGVTCFIYVYLKIKKSLVLNCT